MAMVEISVICEETGLDVNSVRRIGRNIKATQYKDAQVELYCLEDWESFGKPLKKKKMSKPHLAKLQEGARVWRVAEKKRLDAIEAKKKS